MRLRDKLRTDKKFYEDEERDAKQLYFEFVKHFDSGSQVFNPQKVLALLQGSHTQMLHVSRLQQDDHSFVIEVKALVGVWNYQQRGDKMRLTAEQAPR